MIPAMTDPLGNYWKQPPASSILVDGAHAIMDRATRDSLAVYDASLPSGVYVGKMWRCRGWLCWYGPCADPGHCSIERREILLVDSSTAPAPTPGGDK